MEHANLLRRRKNTCKVVGLPDRTSTSRQEMPLNHGLVQPLLRKQVNHALVMAPILHLCRGADLGWMLCQSVVLFSERINIANAGCIYRSVTVSQSLEP